MIWQLYRFLTYAIHPLLLLYLRKRATKGKEDKSRLKERAGIASYPKQKEPSLWIHAASMGESISVLPFVQKITTAFPSLPIVFTTGTVTSARYLATRLPAQAVHQFVPLDTPQAVSRFLNHWQPFMALFVESELWPNMVYGNHARGGITWLLNARMSTRSFERWKRMPGTIAALLKKFETILAQTEKDAERFKALITYSERVEYIGNLKLASPALACDEALLTSWKDNIGNRPVWVAASTHSGEEEMIAETHSILKDSYPDLLTVLIPRHAARGDSIRSSLQSNSAVAQRSKKEPITSATALYIADSMGELGLWYRLSSIAFVGGSLVAHGGQNPLEPARLSCAVISGPYTHNFDAVYTDLRARNAVAEVKDALTLARTVDHLFKNPAEREQMIRLAKEYATSKEDILEHTYSMLKTRLESLQEEKNARA